MKQATGCFDEYPHQIKALRALAERPGTEAEGRVARQKLAELETRAISRDRGYTEQKNMKAFWSLIFMAAAARSQTVVLPDLPNVPALVPDSTWTTISGGDYCTSDASPAFYLPASNSKIVIQHANFGRCAGNLSLIYPLVDLRGVSQLLIDDCNFDGGEQASTVQLLYVNGSQIQVRHSRFRNACYATEVGECHAILTETCQQCDFEDDKLAVSSIGILCAAPVLSSDQGCTDTVIAHNEMWFLPGAMSDPQRLPLAKNFVEFKNANRVLVQGNTGTGFATQGGQGGGIAHGTPRNQTDTSRPCEMPTARVSNVTVEGNTVESGEGVLAAGTDSYCPDSPATAESINWLVVGNTFRLHAAEAHNWALQCDVCRNVIWLRNTVESSSQYFDAFCDTAPCRAFFFNSPLLRLGGQGVVGPGAFQW
jgi:hypothetical protein